MLDKWVSDAAKRDPLVWCVSHIRLPGNRVWDFTSRPWLAEVYRSVNYADVLRGASPRKLVVRKCTQVGLTTLALTRVLEFATQYPGVSVGYYLPRQDDVRDLVTTKLDPVLAESRSLSNRLADLDSTRTKQFGVGAGASFLHFMEASVMPRMLPLDLIVGDEYDLCDQNNMGMVTSRLDASAWKLEFYLSTPTVPEYGIDTLYEASDARQWAVRCPFCGDVQILDWDAHIRYRSNGDAYLGCTHCDKGNDEGFSEEVILGGQWIKKYPDHDVPGFWISELMTPWIPLSTLVKEYRDGKPSIFYNLRLGVPYSPGIGGLSLDEVRTATKAHYPVRFEGEASEGMCMGVDQGDLVYLVVGHRVHDGEAETPEPPTDGAKPVKARYTSEIVYAETVPLDDAEERIAHLIDTFNLKRVVIDAQPNKLLSVRLSRRFPGICWMAYYVEESKESEVCEWNRESRVVLINRTNAFDALLLEEVSRGKWRMWDAGLEDTRSLIFKHASALKRQNVTRHSQSGDQVIGAWRNNKPDHYAHAWNYLRAALSEERGGMRSRAVHGPDPKPAGRPGMQPARISPLVGSVGRIRLLS